MDPITNIHPASASPENPVFFITSRAPAHVYMATSPEDAYQWISNRLRTYRDDPKRAMDFEITDFERS